MRLVWKIVVVLTVVVALSLGIFAAVLSHDAPCGTAPVLPAGMPRMQAVIHRCYGQPQVLTLAEVEKPSVGNHDVRVRVHAASVNPYDAHFLQGSPYIARMILGFASPADPRLGRDFAGTVEAVGREVTRFKAGDEVFGAAALGAFAEYVTVPQEGSIAPKPAGISFAEAAAVPMAGATALEGLTVHGHIRAGEKVLINGASGGVGTFAVQIAKALGAEVTGVCSTAQVERVRSLGADHVIDYTKEDFAQGAARYGLIIDTVGNRSFSAYQRVLEPQGTVVLIGAPPGDWIGPLTPTIHASLLATFGNRSFVTFVAGLSGQDLTELSELMQGGRVRAVIDRHYPLSRTSEAMQYLEAGHAHGKVIIDVDGAPPGSTALPPS